MKGIRFFGIWYLYFNGVLFSGPSIDAVFSDALSFQEGVKK